MFRWRGRPLTTELQVANACDDFVDLTPVSDVRADATKTGWAALLPGQEIPLIGEESYGYEQEC